MSLPPLKFLNDFRSFIIQFFLCSISSYSKTYHYPLNFLRFFSPNKFEYSNNILRDFVKLHEHAAHLGELFLNF